MPSVPAEAPVEQALAAREPPPPVRKRGLATMVLVVALAVLLIGGGVAAAGYYFGWLGGGGPLPSQAMPASTVAYLQLDLDPTPAQKAQAWQFLRDLPEVKQAVAAGNADPKRLLWELLDDWWIFDTDDDFDAEIDPWLGDRVGLGLVKAGDRAAVMTAIEVKDEEAAATKLRAWIRDSQQAFDVTTRDGFALITMTSDTEDVLAELNAGALAQSRTFTGDLASVGESGFLAGWADLAGLAALSPGWSTSGSAVVTGRTAFALRFGSDTMEFAGKALGLDSNAPTPTAAGELGNLPSVTGFGFSVSGGAEAVRGVSPSFDRELDSWVREHGLTRDDVAALLGRSFSIGIPAGSLADSSGRPVVGLRVVTDAAPRAQRALRSLAESMVGPVQLVDRVDGDVLTAATTDDYHRDLAWGFNRLSSSEVFLRAVPDHARATGAFYLNLRPLLNEGDSTGENTDFRRALRAVGGQYLPDGSGGGSWSIRVVRS